MEGRFVHIGSSAIWVAEAAAAEEHDPPVLCLHGMSFDSRSWAAELPALARGRNVYAYDLRGYGRSPAPEEGQVDYVADLAALIALLGLDRPILVGLSLGANIAMAYAQANPCAVRGLVLASPGLPGHIWTSEHAPTVAAALARRVGTAVAKAYWLSHPLFASLARQTEARATVEAMIAGYDGWHWLHPERMTPLPSAADRLDRLTMPVLVVNGALDLDEYRAIGRRIASQAPHARHVELEGAGHVVNLEQPAAFLALLEQFLAVVGAGGEALPPPIPFDLSEPGTFVYGGAEATRGLALNRFALSLKQPANRLAFLADEAGYLEQFALTDEQAAQVRERDWTGLLRNGGHLQAILKLAATVGQSLWDIGAHNSGIGTDAMQRLCPRRVSRLPGHREGAA